MEFPAYVLVGPPSEGHRGCEKGHRNYTTDYEYWFALLSSDIRDEPVEKQVSVQGIYGRPWN